MSLVRRIGLLMLLAVPAAHADIVDLSTATSGTINSALFERSMFTSGGTGNMEPFVRLHGTGTEQGYNTSGRPVPFDEVNGLNYTHDLTLGEVPIQYIAGVQYLELWLDINQAGNAAGAKLSLDSLQIYTSTIASQTTTDIASLGALRFDLDAGEDSWIVLDGRLSSGSGVGDMRALIPASLFEGEAPSTYLYVYSRFGEHHAANSGPEEWAIRAVPAPGAGGVLVVAGVCLSRRRR